MRFAFLLWGTGRGWSWGSAGGQAGRGAQRRAEESTPSLHLLLGFSLSSAIPTVVSQEGTFTSGLRVCVCAYRCADVYKHACALVSVCTHGHACSCVGACLRSHICTCVFMCAVMGTQLGRHRSAHTHVHVLCEHTHVHACTCTCTHKLVCGYACRSMYLWSLHESLCNACCVCVDKYLCSRVHTCAHVYVCTHVSVYVCICACVCMCEFVSMSACTCVGVQFLSRAIRELARLAR